MPVPRVDLRARRLPARGAAHEGRPRLRARRARAAPARRSAPGARSCSSTPTRTRRRSRRRSATCPEVVRAHGLDVDALRLHHRVEYEIRANWKIALENYLECYHCQLNHPGLVSVIDDRNLTMDASGLRASQFNPAHPDFDVGDGIPQGQFHLLFPSLKVNAQPGHAEPVDRAGLARRARPLPRLPRLLVRAGRLRGVDRGLPRLRRPGRRRGHRAGRGRAARRGQRPGPGGPPARPRRAAHRPLPGLRARPAHLSSPREMTRRWMSEVPSSISSSFASRIHFSTGYSRE